VTKDPENPSQGLHSMWPAAWIIMAGSIRLVECAQLKDEIYREAPSKLAGFDFDERVAAVFDDMAERSIPLYHEVQETIVALIGEYVAPGSRVYDLGCSTGSMTARLATGLPELEEIIAIDNAEAMIDRARENTARLETGVRIETRVSDLRELEIEDAAAAVMCYTLMFIRPIYREQVLRNIYDGLRPGGVLVLTEKVLEESTELSRLFIEAHFRYKRARGYSDLEISRKREQLENVLVPYRVHELDELLHRCGFHETAVFFKWHNFAGLIALKPR